MTTQQIGKELGVEYIIEGRVQRTGRQVKVFVDLNNTENGNVEWVSEPFVEDEKDIASFDQKITQQIINQLEVRLSKGEAERFMEASTSNAKAYDLYLRGIEILNNSDGTVESLNSAIQYFQKSKELDPKFDKAYIGLAQTYLMYIFWGRMATTDAVDKAFNALFKCSDHESGEYLGMLGSINFYRLKKTTARKMLTEAIELSPNFIEPYVDLSWLDLYDGHINDAQKKLDIARSLDPHSMIYVVDKSAVYYYAHEYKKSIEIIQDELKTHPDDNFLKWQLGFVYAGQGKYDQAIEEFQGRSLGTNTNWMLAYSLGMKGDTSRAREILNIHLEKRKNQYVPAHMIGTIYLGLKEYEHALDWLETEIQDGGQGHFLMEIQFDPKFKPLYDYDRFKKILKMIRNGD